jgi:hypothetical protein
MPNDNVSTPYSPLPMADEGRSSEEDSEDFNPRNWAPGSRIATRDTFSYDDGRDEDDIDFFVGAFRCPPMKGGKSEARRVVCRTCERVFKSNNARHTHLRDCHDDKVMSVYTVTAADPDVFEPSKPKAKPAEKTAKRLRIVKSSALPPVNGAVPVRNWHELGVAIRSSRTGPDFSVCPDTGAAITLADKSFIETKLPSAGHGVWALVN